MMEAKMSNGKLHITIDTLPEMYETDSGKSYMVATSGGIQVTPIVVAIKDKDGKERKMPMKLGVNAFVPNPDYVKPSKGLN